MESFDYSSYLSPFTWRYGSAEMRRIWSEVHKRKLWRKIWVALAKVQQKAGLLTKEEFEDIEKNSENVDIKKAHEIEKEIYHDLMAEVRVFSQQAKVGGGKIHLGATSTDIDDNAEIVRIREALDIVEEKLQKLLKSFVVQINKYRNTICMGYTHLQPAEPTTLGYRFCIYAQDLLNDLKLLEYFRKNLKAKGIKGAIGTSASYKRLLKSTKMDASQLSKEVMEALDLSETIVSGQTYPRKTDFHLAFILSSIAQSIHKFCFDLRIMQSPNFGEWSEPRSTKRVGSSAMPFKRNPDKAEKICSLSRFISALLTIAWENAASSLLERTLDDSANRRVFIPEGFLATDEILTETNKLIEGLVVFEENIKRNLEKYGPFAGTESILMEAVKNGANRQTMHEVLRELSMKAWEEIQQGKTNPLTKFLISDKRIIQFVPAGQVEKLLNPKTHIGLAPQYCEKLVKEMP